MQCKIHSVVQLSLSSSKQSKRYNVVAMTWIFGQRWFQLIGLHMMYNSTIIEVQTIFNLRLLRWRCLNCCRVSGAIPSGRDLQCGFGVESCRLRSCWYNRCRQGGDAFLSLSVYLAGWGSTCPNASVYLGMRQSRPAHHTGVTQARFVDKQCQDPLEADHT